MNSQINPEIVETLNKFNIKDKSAALIYLFCIRENIVIDNDFMVKHELTVKQVHISKVCELVGIENIQWNIPFYVSDIEPDDDNWKWVKEYQKVFKDIRADKGGSLADCVRRMKKFFAEHPEVRKEDVIDAARLYTTTCDNWNYLQNAHYFISKGVSNLKTSRLEQYLELVYEYRREEEQRALAAQNRPLR
jgi:hypothetical protein